jgi:hypothetical protein
MICILWMTPHRTCWNFRRSVRTGHVKGRQPRPSFLYCLCQHLSSLRAATDALVVPVQSERRNEVQGYRQGGVRAAAKRLIPCTFSMYTAGKPPRCIPIKGAASSRLHFLFGLNLDVQVFAVVQRHTLFTYHETTTSTVRNPAFRRKRNLEKRYQYPPGRATAEVRPLLSRARSPTLIALGARCK